jgi:(2Fe-2S) ferredoxin
MRFQKHLFICINQRNDQSRQSCGEEKGMELVTAFKKQIKMLGLQTTMRAQRTGCLDACETGPTVVVYPDGIFYGGVTPADVDEIVSSHLVMNKPVERLIIRTFPVKTSG